jgi:hypothetical protein
VSDGLEIFGGAGSLEAAAIVAALARLVEEQSALAARPPARPRPSLWVMSGRPRRVEQPFTRATPESPAWSVGDSDDEEIPV